MCDWLAFGALYARNGRTIRGRQILTEDWVRMTTSPSHFAPHGEGSFFESREFIVSDRLAGEYGLHW
jgi:CubicO group peptidase (beta-lactamase class C family)